MDMPWQKKKEAPKEATPEAPKQEKLESNVTLPPEPEQAVTPKTVEPIQAPVPVVEAPVNKPVVDAFTLAMFVWAMYRLNVLTRIQVRDFLMIIKKGDWPVDVVKYLTDEVKKL